MWFGTKDGLNRFDGYTFKIFRHDADDSASIGSNFIQILYESNGKLWIGTDKGLYWYDAQTENFSLVKVTFNSSIRSIAMDGQGYLWFISGVTLYRYDENREILQSYNTNKYFEATSICYTSDGGLWVSSSAGILNKYDSAHDSFISFDMFAHSMPTSTHWIEKIYSTGDNTILIGTQSQGVKVFDIATTSYKDIKAFDEDDSELYVRDFIEADNNEYWVASESGIYIYNKINETFINLKKSYSNPYAISDNAIYSLCTDKEGGIWAGTYFGGVNYYPKQYIAFEKFSPKTKENSISGNAVREICADKYGNIWIGTEDAGLNKYNPATGRFTNFIPTGKKDGISHYNIHGLLAIEDELWIGTFLHGLDVMDIKTGKVVRHYTAGPEPNALKSNFIYSIIQTASGDILVGTAHGLYRYNPESDDFTTLSAYPEIYQYTVKIMEDREGTIWAATYSDGIYYINPYTQEKGYFKHEPENKHSLSGNAVTDIFEDSKGNLWFATEGGLSKFNAKERNFKRYTTANGFPSNVIYNLEEDEENKLWIGTSKGLVKFDPVSGDTKVYTKAHGLLNDQFNYSSSYKDPEGKMYFGSVNGMISFNPAEFVQNTFIPPICITGIQISNEELEVNKKGSPLKKSIIYTDKIILKHHQSSFSLDFAALSYTAPEMTEYTYKMEGLESEWTYLKTNRKVFFTDLKPGEYTFMVKASNSSGLWNDEPSLLKIEILPPFWASKWAYFLYTALAMCIVYWSIRNYHRQIENRNRRKMKLLESEKEKEIYQAKVEFFTNVAHEIRTPLTLIKGPLEKTIKLASDEPGIRSNLQIMEKNTNRLLDLANQLLDFRKTETKGFNLTFVKADVSALLQETYSRFKPAAEQKDMSFALEMPDTHLHAYIDKEALIKILSNLFNNAIKYGETYASIRLLPFDTKDNPTFFTIVIKNDGPLISPEMKEKVFEPFFRMDETEKQTGTGIGLPLARSLAELHKGTLEVNLADNETNTLVLTLPIHQEKGFTLFDEMPEALYIPEESPKEEDLKEIKPAILLVEDNIEILEFISAELLENYTVLKATDGEKALAILTKENIQLVVSDIMMPMMDGFELCKQMKTNLDYSHIPIILLTAKNTLQAKIEGLESGADAYIEKPFSPEHLQVQIANLLTNRNKLKEYFYNSPLAHIKTIAYSKADETFLERLNAAIYKNIADSELNVDLLADLMHMSRPTLYRKIKALSNLTPNELINIARLKKAAELLASGDYKIYEVAHIVGYNSQTSFGRNFLKQFGMTPSEYATKAQGSI